MFTTKTQIRDAMVEGGVPAADAEKLASAARPGVWLRTTPAPDEDMIPIGATKLGGRPDLPGDVAWPVRPAYPNHAERTKFMRKTLESKNPWPWAKPERREELRADTLAHIALVERAAPLTFLAQIDFGSLVTVVDPDMPTSGLLSIFYDIAEQPWGFDPQERMAVAFVFSDGGTLKRREPPAELDVRYRLRPLACEQTPCMTPVSADSPVCGELGVDEESRDTLHSWWNEDDNMYSTEGGTTWKCHRIGGWPNAVQGSMQVQCALVAAGHYCGDTKAYNDPDLAAMRATANEWLMLAQIGTDKQGDLAWGDNGQLYAWIRRDDLKAGRFDKALLILQCY